MYGSISNRGSEVRADVPIIGDENNVGIYKDPTKDWEFWTVFADRSTIDVFFFK